MKDIGKHNKEIIKRHDRTNNYLRELVGLQKEGNKKELGDLGKTVNTSDVVVNRNKKEKEEVGVIKKAMVKFSGVMKSLNEKVIKPIYGVIKHIKDTIITHVRDGMKKIGGYFKSHLTTILEPISEISGPLIAISQSLFGFGKALFGKKEKREKKDSKTLQNILSIFTIFFDDVKKNRALKGTKQTGLMKYLIPLTALFVGFFGGLFKQLGMFFKPIKTLFQSIKGIFMNLKIIKDSKFLAKFFGFFDKLKSLIAKSPLAKILGAVGRLFGSLLMPLMMFYDAYKGWMNAETIRDKILGAAAGILDVFFSLPEWIANTILGLFTDFRVDFSAQAIIDAINGISDWLFDAVTVPVMDFFTITIPNAFNSLKDNITNLFKGGIDFATMMKDQLIDMLINLLGDVPIIGGYIKKLADMKSAPTVGEVSVTKNTNTASNTNGVNVARANATLEQIRGNRETVDTLNTTNKNLTENIGVNKQIVQNQQNIQINNDSNNDIPSDPENMGVLLYSKSWGMA